MYTFRVRLYDNLLNLFNFQCIQYVHILYTFHLIFYNHSPASEQRKEATFLPHTPHQKLQKIKGS
jgi:hypothetical protein